MEKLEFECKTLSPLDGRYGKIKDALGDYFSEYALVKYRVFVEISWLKYLIDHVDTPVLNDAKKKDLSGVEKISSEFNYDSYKRIKEIEATTRHDVKAVEYYIDEQLKALGFEHLESFVHIGCTSEDINNTSYGCMIRDGLKNVWLKAAYDFAKTIDGLAVKYADIPMLAHTHGQPATPTTVGKEFKVYAYRFKCALEHIESIAIKAKFNGATGNYSAIGIPFPNIDWEKANKEFVEDYLGLTFNPLTTQI